MFWNKKKQNNTKDTNDNECQVDRPIADSFYCKQISMLDLLNIIIKENN